MPVAGEFLAHPRTVDLTLGGVVQHVQLHSTGQERSHPRSLNRYRYRKPGYPPEVVAGSAGPGPLVAVAVVDERGAQPGEDLGGGLEQRLGPRVADLGDVTAQLPTRVIVALTLTALTVVVIVCLAGGQASTGRLTPFPGASAYGILQAGGLLFLGCSQGKPKSRHELSWVSGGWSVPSFRAV